MNHRPELVQSVAGILVVAVAFVIVSVLAQANEAAIGGFIRGGGILGPTLFLVATAISLVFLIPLDVSVFIPLAIVAWGPFATALLSVIGWTAGSSCSLYLARRYGRPFVERVIGVEHVGEAKDHAPKHHLFWWVVAAQALVQVDFVSYIFGLFTEIDLRSYALATALGDLVPGFFFAYVGALPLWYEIAALFAALALTGFLLWRFVGRFSKR